MRILTKVAVAVTLLGCAPQPRKELAKPAAKGRPSVLVFNVVRGDKTTLHTLPDGLLPSDLQGAYGKPGGSPTQWNALNESHKYTAIVISGEFKHASTVINAFRSQFSLGACTTANNCLRLVDENGTDQDIPTQITSEDWTDAAAITADMASLMNPDQGLVIVQLPQNVEDLDSLTAAGEIAAAMTDVNRVILPFVGDETDTEDFAARLESSQSAIFVPAGDEGYLANNVAKLFPASVAKDNVFTVAPTKLSTALNGRGWIDEVEPTASSGASTVYSRPAWQSHANAKRVIADIAMVGSPDSVVVGYSEHSGTGDFRQFAGSVVGTGLAASLSTYYVDGVPSETVVQQAPSGLIDLTTGSTGSCGGTFLCTAISGFDGPTGIGVLIGFAAFEPQS